MKNIEAPFDAIMQEDLNNIADTLDFCDELKGKSVLITGATGLVGSYIVKALCCINRLKNTGIKIMPHVRNPQKAETIFGDILKRDDVLLCTGDITEEIITPTDADYIIHTASVTASKTFVSQPVETIFTAIDGTRNVLEYARKANSKSVVYISSMEVYGTPETDETIDELHSTDLNTMEVRNSYPESKRMCENICISYAAQYGFKANIVRLTQTFGPGVSYNDTRVFAEFMRCAAEKKDIILHTYGETKRNYLYIADAVTAILTVMLKGEPSTAYNAANEATYCSIYEMACMVAEKCANGEIKVRCEVEEDLSKYGYAKTLHMNLDTSRLCSLGWKPTADLATMFQRMIGSVVKK